MAWTQNVCYVHPKTFVFIFCAVKYLASCAADAHKNAYKSSCKVSAVFNNFEQNCTC